MDIERVRRLREEYEALLDNAEVGRAAYHQALKELYRSGVPLRELAEQLGMSHQRVHQIVGETPPSKTRNRRIIGATIGAVTLLAVVLVAVVLTRDRVFDEPPTRQPPTVSVDVLTKGQSWLFQYPRYGVSLSDGSPEIVLPAGSRIRFTLRSADALHAIWIPQLGPKKLIVPGLTKELVIQTPAHGTYTGRDAEFAGITYELPEFEVRIVTISEFEHWVADHRFSGTTDRVGPVWMTSDTARRWSSHSLLPWPPSSSWIFLCKSLTAIWTRCASV